MNSIHATSEAHGVGPSGSWSEAVTGDRLAARVAGCAYTEEALLIGVLALNAPYSVWDFLSFLAC